MHFYAFEHEASDGHTGTSLIEPEMGEGGCFGIGFCRIKPVCLKKLSQFIFLCIYKLNRIKSSSAIHSILVYVHLDLAECQISSPSWALATLIYRKIAELLLAPSFPANKTYPLILVR